MLLLASPFRRITPLAYILPRLLQCAHKLEEWQQFCKKRKRPRLSIPTVRWSLGPVMASQSFDLRTDALDLSARLLSAQEVVPRARIVARFLVDHLLGAAVNVYILHSSAGEGVWLPRASFGEVSVQEGSVPAETGTLGELKAQQIPLIFSGKELLRENYA